MDAQEQDATLKGNDMKDLKAYEVLRNSVLAEVKASPNYPLSINDLIDKPSVKASMKSGQQVQNLLKNMYHSGQLHRVRINRPGDQSIYAYEIGHGLSINQIVKSVPVGAANNLKFNIKVGKAGDYVEVTLKGLHLRITVGD